LVIIRVLDSFQSKNKILSTQSNKEL